MASAFDTDQLAGAGAPASRRDWRGWWRWPLLVGFWTLPAALLASQIHFMMVLEGRPVSWASLFWWQAVGWYFWVPVTPLVLWLARRFALDRRRWWRSGMVHLAAAATLAALHAGLLVSVTRWLGPERYQAIPDGHMLAMWLTQRLQPDLLIYASLTGIGYGLESYRKSRERELQASQLEAQLAHAQLQALRMQLHPHFLFNTLHAISVLVRRGANQQAVRMLVGLSDLLRMALDNVGAQEVPLRQELEFLERYLELEQIRFQDRLRVELDIAPDTLDSPIPNLILQPLVENAIRHGVAQRPAAGRVRILARRHDKRLRIEVQDDGPGMPGESMAREGVGLGSTRKRLQRLYGADHSFRVSNGEHGGAIAVLDIPWRPALA